MDAGPPSHAPPQPISGWSVGRDGAARRLRIAAALHHRKIAPTVVLYNDRYTRGPVNLATMMKGGLI